MSSMNADYLLDQGSTFVLEFKMYDEDLQSVSLLNNQTPLYSFRMKLRKTKYRGVSLFGLTEAATFVVPSGTTPDFTSNGFYLVEGNTGFVRFVITSDTTASFKPGMYFYDIEAVQSLTGGNVVSKVLSGKFDIDAESTR